MSKWIKKASLLWSAALAAVLLCGCFAGGESGSDESGAANASSSESVASGTSAGDAELPEENNYLKNTSFEKGFRVYKTTEGVGDFHALPLETSLSNVQPDWTLAQWASKYDIIGAQRTAAFGEVSFVCGETSPPAKRVDVNTRTGNISLELNAETEYERDRLNGEQWPHLLIGQDWAGEELLRIADMQSLVLRMDYEVTKIEDKSYSVPNPGLHCAQFVWYVTLQNRNADSADFGKYVWFGLNLFDNRMAGSVSDGFAAQDGGKEQNTGAFIYQPSSAVWSDDGRVPSAGEEKEVSFDIVEEARSAYELAVERNFLGSTRFEDLYIGSTNLGFEVTGTYNIAAKIGNLGIVWREKAQTLPPQNKQ